jgi:hypothetical protein
LRCLAGSQAAPGLARDDYIWGARIARRSFMSR